MIDIYLKFTDEAQFMLTVNIDELPENGYFIETFDGIRSDLIATGGNGIILKPTGEVITIDGEEVPVMAPIDGYHVNVRCMGDETPATFAPYVIQPQNPVQGWG